MPSESDVVFTLKVFTYISNFYCHLIYTFFTEFSDPSSSDPRFSNDQSSGFDSSWNTTSQSGKSYGISEFDRDDRPQNSFGLQDDSFVDENNDGSGGQPLNRGGTSYDELRMRNRSAFKNV